MSKKSVGRTAFEIRDLLASEPGECAVCTVTRRGVRHHVDLLFYERATDIATRETIRNAGGFCRRHARLVSEHADALGTALIMRDVLINQLRALEGGAWDQPPQTTGTLARILDGARQTRQVRPECPLCEVEREAETLAIDDLLAALPDAEFAAAFRASSGLCLPHFRLAFDRCRDEAIWTAVLETQRAAMTSLAGELDELARKYDYRYRDEARGAESNSWRRALDLTSGETER